MDGKHLFAMVNALLNASSTVLLIAAYVQIKRGKWRAHGKLMLSAFAVSSVFLVTYLTSKGLYGEVTTESLGLQWGVLKAAYLVILIPHVLLAIVMLPFILAALWQAYHRRWERHTRFSVPAFWIWLFVSVTGVVVYFLLYHVIPAALVTETA